MEASGLETALDGVGGIPPLVGIVMVIGASRPMLSGSENVLLVVVETAVLEGLPCEIEEVMLGDGELPTLVDDELLTPPVGSREVARTDVELLLVETSPRG